MIGAADRKLVELDQKLATVRAEFAYWQAATAEDGQLPRHNSQVLRLTGQLEALVEHVAAWLAEVRGDPRRVGAESRRIEVAILDIHRIWDFFRAKLAQRFVDLFKDYLVVADDLAWACYEPAQKAADPALVPPASVKQPPLVFLNGGWSPYVAPRGARFEAEYVPDADISARQFERILNDLPIPVIGVPWYQTRHIPDAVVIGHEVGHCVEDDFRLTGTITALLDAALESKKIPEYRRGAWRCWLGEIFADIYGILATGPAAVGTLMDILAGTPDEIMSERRSDPAWSQYPTVALRIEINLTTLDLLKLDAAEHLRTAWSGRVPHHAMAEFDEDIEAVVMALLTGPYPELGGRALTDILSFGPEDVANAELVTRSLAKKMPPGGPIRPLIAGARRAFEDDPEAFVERQAGDVVLRTIIATRDNAVRRLGNEVALEDDIAAGARLFEMLKLLRSGSDSAIDS